jgi:MFS family permease
VVARAPQRWRAARSLLAERDFRILLGAQFLAQAGDGFAQAIVADRLILDPLQAGTPQRILVLFAVTLVPYSVLAPFLGVFVDRWPRRTLLWATNAARGAALIALAIPAATPDSSLFIAVVVLLGLGRLFLVTKGASLPFVVHERDLLRANALSGGGGMISALLGGVAGLVALGFMDIRAALLVAVGLYGLASFVARLLSDPMAHVRSAPIGGEVKRILGELTDGVKQIWKRAQVRLPILAVFVVRTSATLVTVATILVIKDEFSDPGRRRLIGALALGAAGAGAFLGAAIAPALGRRLLKPGLVVAGFFASGLGIVVLGGIDSLPALFALTFTGGLGTFTAKIAVDAQVQESLPDIYRGRAFAIYDILYNLASVAAAGIIVAAEHYPLRGLLVSAGAVTLLVAFVLAVAMSRAGMQMLRDDARPA